MTLKQKRLGLIAAGLLLLSSAVGLVLYALQDNLQFFYTPTQVKSGEAPQSRAFRVGGLVEAGSVKRTGLDVSFQVTDTAQIVPVTYTGILPDLFKEGKGVVAQGTLGPDGVFRAKEVLAKHDENYMPPEAQAAVDKAHQARERAQKTLK
ncbi:MAG: cytochrome c maturation protein CcmE [Burkholderiales bacterium]|jgi:cytochrome c-type biogenesis protein CcmE|nr:MAG: cytochrome c maturation protein CcmE [Burkholderiales bacterium]TAG83207.1 MAG: cytochrome c maturation protein CcmE [Betaproteobacteria bacterium]